jgi:putative ABC transport system ATP-binding protein
VMDNILILNKVHGLAVTKEEIYKLAEQLNFDHRLNHKPSEMSIGEKQRVSLVRALAIKPEIILADEPTGNLDPENAEEVLKYLDQFHSKGGTVVMVSHGSDADKYATQHINLEQGGIISNK